MLWESVEPMAALDERFGFGGFDAAADWLARLLEATWGVAVRRCHRIVISDNNAVGWLNSDQGDLVVKWSRAHERFARLDASTQLLRKLAGLGLPVASPLATVAGPHRVIVGGPAGLLSVSLLPELAGQWLDVSDRLAVQSAGACLAQLHRALAAIDVPGLPMAAPTAGLQERIEAWLTKGDHGHAPEASRRLQSLRRLPELDDDPQLVHNDFRAANILTQNSTVTGVLDFDDVLVDHRVHDFAKACVYLSTRFTDWQLTPTAVRQSFRSGYESVRPFSPEESRWLEVLVLWQGIMAVPNAKDTAAWASAL